MAGSIKRQTAVDWSDKPRQTVKSKSLPETEHERPQRRSSITESCGELQEKRKKTKKKKKRKANWEKKVKTVTNMSVFIRKPKGA